MNTKESKLQVRMKLQQKLLFGFLGVILISIFVSVFSYSMQTRREETRRQVDDAKLVQNKGVEVMLGVVNMETGFRGFLITGQDVFMAPYNQGKKNAEDALTELEALTAGNEKQQNRWKTIRQQMKAWEDNWAAPGMDLRRQVSAGTATIDQVVEYESRAGGKLYTDTIRAMVSESQSTATKQLDDAEAEYNKALAADMAVKLWGTVLGAVIGIGIAVWMAQTISRAVRQMVVAAERIARGEIDQTISYRSGDEIGQLAAAFRSMIAYIQRMARAADALADLNLSVKVQPRSERDVLGVAFQQMAGNMRMLVNDLNQNVQSLSHASAQLASTANQASLATSQIATTIQQVARGTAQQTEATTHTAESMDQMGKAIDGVARGAGEQAEAVGRASAITAQLSQSIQQLADTTQDSVRGSADAAQAAERGVQVIGQALGAMDAIRGKVGQSAEKVKEMGARSEQIGMIVETIDDIASQTNLLALNAAIEAARAGEHGKGFAVVADEVRKLAERSSAATKEIGGLIRSIQQSVAAAMKAMEDGVREVEAGSQRANQSGEALVSIQKTVETVSVKAVYGVQVAKAATLASNELVSAMDTVSAVVEENTAATEQMSANSAEVTQAIENIASVSEENSAAVEEVSASTEEMAAQVEEVTAAAASLAQLAKELEGMVAQFRLESDGTEDQDGSEREDDTEQFESIEDESSGGTRAAEVAGAVLRSAGQAVKWTAGGTARLVRKTAKKAADSRAAKQAAQRVGPPSTRDESEVVAAEPVEVDPATSGELKIQTIAVQAEAPVGVEEETAGSD